MEHQPGLVPETETAATFVVYDTIDGTIVHSHKVVTAASVPESSDEEAEKVALHYAHYVAGAARDRVAVLRVSEEEMRPGLEHRVDVEARRLVADGDVSPS